jgi:hypothetical protein
MPGLAFLVRIFMLLFGGILIVIAIVTIIVFTIIPVVIVIITFLSYDYCLYRL